MADGGIEFLIELESKLDGAVQATGALHKLMLEAEKTDRSVRKFEADGKGAFSRLANSARDFGRTAGAVFAGVAAWDGLKTGIALAGELGHAMLQAAGEEQRTQAAFSNLLGEEKGRDLLERLDRVSKSTEFTDGPVKAFAQSLTDAGFAGEDLANAMAATFDVAARSPNKMAGAEAATGALERLMLTGTADARTLRALKISPRALYAQMSKDLGMGQKEVEKKLGEGKIRTQDALNSVFKALAGRNKSGMLGTAGAEMSTLFDARLEKLRDLPANLFQNLAGSAGLQRLSDSIGKALGAFDPDSALGQKVTASLERMLGKLGAMVERIDFARLADTLTKIFERLPGLIESTTKALLALAGVVGKVINTENIEQFQRGAGRAKSLFRFTTPFGLLGEAKDLFSKAGKAAGDGFAGGIQPALPAVERSTQQVGDVAQHGLAERLGIHSPSRVFMHLGEMSVAGYAQGLEMAPPSLSAKTFLDGIAPKSGSMLSPLTISSSPTINVTVAGSSASAEQIAEAVRIEVPSSIVSALEQLGLGRGAS